MLRRLCSAVVYAAYLVGVVTAAAWLLLWLPFRAELRERHPPGERIHLPRHVDETLMRRVGSIATGRPGTFVHFERGKPPGVTRACALGDSYTYGDEVAPGNDPPALLQSLAREQGRRDLEVLNFASNWHGFHQSFLVWEGLARGFGCDFVLIGPASFQEERDVRINHTRLSRPYYLHARYVLDAAGELRLVEVGGDTPRARFDDYFRFLPRWRYLRYDRSPPPVLLSLIPAGRTLANPFYHDDRSSREEALDTWAVMLRRIADAARVVVVHRDPEIVALVESLGSERAVAARAFDSWLFPNRAPRGHNSAWANRVLARQFYAQLVEGPVAPAPILQIGGAITPAAGAGAGAVPPLSAFDTVEIAAGDVTLGSLFTTSRNFLRAGGAADLAGAASALLVKDPRSATTDAAFVPLAFALGDGSPVSLRVEGGEPVVLGRVRMLPGIPIGVADLVGFELEAHRELVLHVGVAGTARGVRRMTLFVGDAPAMEGFASAGRTVFYPVTGTVLQFAADAPHAADPDALPDSGTLALVLRGSAGERRAPFGDWRQRDAPFHVADRSLPGRLPARPPLLAGGAR